MKNKVIVFLVFIFIAFLGVTILPGQALGVSCAPGYIQGNVPTTQIPDYNYTSDGFLEFHFRLTNPNWKYNYGHDIHYREDCSRVDNWMGNFETPEKISTWPGVSHLILRYTYKQYPYNSGCEFGCYHSDLYNGDTGELLDDIVDHYSILGQIYGTYYIPPYPNVPVIKFIFGNLTKANYDAGIEEGDLISTPTLPIRIVPNKNPVLVVPGIAGTEIKKGSETLWVDVSRMIIDPIDSFINLLAFNNNLNPIDSEVISKNVIKSVTGFDYSDGLIQEFTKQNYVEGQTLFTFPYDWRYGASGKYPSTSSGQVLTNADLLAKKIQDIMAQTGANKVDVIAHSMGGLIVKEYAMNHPTDNHIGKAVFVGVPNTGAPDAVKALIQGDNFGISFGPFGLSDAEMKKIAQNMPGVYDLLPSQSYYNNAGSFVRLMDNTSNSSLGIFSINDQTLVDDLDYGQSKSFLVDADGTLNSLAASNADSLHTQAFDNFDLRSAGIDLYAIDGCKTATMTKFEQAKYKDIFGQTQTSYAPFEMKIGDGTVPIQSSTNLPIDQGKKYYSLIGEHSKLLSQDGTRQEIVNLISGSSLNVPSNLVTQDVSQCQLDGDVIEVYSPVDISVTDRNGNHAGLVNGNTTNTIPNAKFEVWDNHKFIYLPTDAGQIYTVNMQGTGTGIYTIDVKNIANSKVAKEELFQQLPVTSNLTGQINLSGNQTTLFVLQDANSLPQTVIPSQTFDYAKDQTPPEAVIQFDPIAKDIKFTGIDNLSSNQLVAVQDLQSKVVLADQAGNTTELVLNEQSRRSQMVASLKTVNYNGIPASISSNTMKFSWGLDKKSNLNTLSQYVKAKNGYTVTAVFDGKNTKITGTVSTGKISQSFPGLKIIKVSTNKGDLSWSY